MAKNPDWTNTEKQIIIKNWVTLPKADMLSLLPKRDWGGIVHKASRLKLKGRPNVNHIRGMNSKYSVDINFFKNWTRESAYVFGRCITDGSWRLRKTGGELRIKSIDKENLEKIKFVMKSEHKIKKTKIPQGQYIYVFDIYNNEIVKDISALENRMYELIKGDYFYDFLRGFIDGDGGIYIKKKSLTINLFNNNLKLLNAINERLDNKGTIYKRQNMSVLYFNSATAPQICQKLYTPRPFLYLSRKLSTWELWQAKIGNLKD